jgi:hypothetical protein
VVYRYLLATPYERAPTFTSCYQRLTAVNSGYQLFQQLLVFTSCRVLATTVIALKQPLKRVFDGHKWYNMAWQGYRQLCPGA